MSKILFTPSRLSVALAALTIASFSHGAGLDRSGQDIKGFFNEGTYAEVDYVYIDTEISGHDHGEPTAIVDMGKEFVKGGETGNTTSDASSFVRYGVKADVNDNVSIGVFYDEPWGADVRYTGDSNFVSKGDQKVIVTDKSPIDGKPLILDLNTLDTRLDDAGYDPQTNVSVETESWTGLVGLKAGGFQVYGGPVLQRASAEVHLRGNAYGPLTGYDAIAKNDTAVGWAAGVAYSKPEIALNAALTYRSGIEHEATIFEEMPALGNATVKYGIGLSDYSGDLDTSDLKTSTNNKTTITTPESVNFNFQTGLSAEHQLLGTLDVRWVPWSDFTIVPPLYNAYSKVKTEDDKGLPLLSYDKDQWKVDVGLAKRFSPAVAGSVQVGWDSGAGNPTSSLGTVEGYYSVGGGVKVNVTPEWAISAGGKYLMFGDAKGQLPSGNQVSEFSDNDGYIAGLKLSYEGN